MKHLVLVDGHSLAYRMYFALERTQMKTAKQVPTWGVYGFFKALFDLMKSVEPDGMAVAFDVGRVTFRTELYPEYKAHRQAMPDSLREQMQHIRKGVELLGIPIFEVQNYEADDLIGTLARQAASEGVQVKILTGDQDAFQIIDDYANISVLLPSFKGGLSEYTREKVFEKLGIYPDQVTDFKGLKGDTSDNIPGIPGIGDKTAAKLLSEYTTLENVLSHAADVSGNKLRQSLIDFKDQALLSKDLATIRYDAPVSFSRGDCLLHVPDLEPFLAFLTEMEFRSFISQKQTLLKPFLGQSLDPQASLQKPEVEPGQQTLALTQDSQLSLGVTDLLPYYQVPFELVTTMSQLTAFLSHVQQTHVLALDIETSGLDVFSSHFAGIALSWHPALSLLKVPSANLLQLHPYPKTVYKLAWDNQTGSQPITVYIPLQHPQLQSELTVEAVLQALKPYLEDEHTAKICHNAKFEWNMFRRHGIHFAGPVFDTMIASYVLNPDRRHGLKQLAHDVLGHNMQDIETLIGKGKKQISFTEVSVADAAPYAACDAQMVIELAAVFLPLLTESLSTLLYEIELPLVGVLADMEYNGVSLDVPYLQKLGSQLDEMLQAVEKEIYAMAGLTFNLNSPKQVGEVFFDHLKIPAKGLTPTKSGYTTNAKVLETLALEYPIVQKLLDYRQLFKLKSTYVDTLPSLVSPFDNRLHGSFNQAITATGRLSSTEPNLQNIPIRSELGRSIRQGFVPAKQQSYKILSADYSQIELRLLAHFSEDPALIGAFQSGEDIHTATAALMFDVPIEAVTKDMRYKAKAVNFGIIYGQTAFGLSQGLKIPPKEAADFIAKYFERYPKVKTYIESSRAEIRETGRVKTLCGRYRDVSKDLASNIKSVREFAERAAFNMPLQGTAADLMKVAMIRLHHAIQDKQLDAKLILQVHDEMVLEVAEAHLDAVEDTVIWAMALGQPLKVPLDVDISVGPSWMEA